LTGKIATSTYVGSHMEYVIDTVAGTLFAVCPRVERPLAQGCDVVLELSPRGLVVIDNLA
jgi:iron(III) transport system ATP-binding protein